jgi:2'-5' RNA ligase
VAASSRRVFFALWPDPGLREALARLAAEVARETEGRATAREKLHLTLAFLGQQSVERIATLAALAPRVAFPAFTLALDEVGSFRASGIAWLGAGTPAPGLLALQAELASALRKEAFPVEERPYSPHLTLARRARKPASRRLAAPIAWRVSSFALVASDRGAAGPAYVSLGEWPARGG